MKRLLVAAVLVGCGGSRNAPERLGDEAWHRGEWGVAAVEYQRAGTTPILLAKSADAALLAGSLTSAATLYRQLGEADPARTGEAAAGLVRVAGVAERNGDHPALAASIDGLRAVAPGWPLGRLALRLPADSAWAAPLAATLALAGLAGGGTSDRWLLTLGRAWRGTGRCVDAVGALETLQRRVTGALADTASLLLAACELSLGLAVSGAEHRSEAERWLERAAARDPLGASGRRALVAIGDSRLARGDVAAAMLAWQQAATAPVPPDSITVLALERLRTAGLPGGAPDSSVVPGPP